MEPARSRAHPLRRRLWLPWALLGGLVALGGVGAGLAVRSISSLVARNAELEREAAESEARVAELQLLRASMERRLRALERQRPRPALTSAESSSRESSPGEPSFREASPGARRGTDAQLAGRQAARKMLEARLKEELRRGDVWLEEADGRLRVQLRSRLLFEPERPTLRPQGAALLARAAEVLAPLSDHTLQVAAHTDESPAAGVLQGPGGAPATSWELSTARAVQVVRLLVDKGRLPPERLSATGHASFRPVESPHTPSARPRNRRVELLLAPAPPASDGVSARAARER